MKKNLVLAAVMAMMVLPTFAAKLVKVGIINNDPNESGYRTANVNDMKKTFTKKNGYKPTFFYSLKNDEQIAAALRAYLDYVSERTK